MHKEWTKSTKLRRLGKDICSFFLFFPQLLHFSWHSRCSPRSPYSSSCASCSSPPPRSHVASFCPPCSIITLITLISTATVTPLEISPCCPIVRPKWRCHHGTQRIHPPVLNHKSTSLSIHQPISHDHHSATTTATARIMRRTITSYRCASNSVLPKNQTTLSNIFQMITVINNTL